MDVAFDDFGIRAPGLSEIRLPPGPDRPRWTGQNRHLYRANFRVRPRLAVDDGLLILVTERFRSDLTAQIAIDARIVNKEVTGDVTGKDGMQVGHMETGNSRASLNFYPMVATRSGRIL